MHVPAINSWSLCKLISWILSGDGFIEIEHIVVVTLNLVMFENCMFFYLIV